MRINSIQVQSHQNKTSFKSKLPSVNATYNINPLQADIIPDYWSELTESCDTSQKETLNNLLTKLTQNFDNNVLALSALKDKNGKINTHIFRLYKNTDELLKHAGSRSAFYNAKNYYNSQIVIEKNVLGDYCVSCDGKVGKYDGIQFNDITNVITKVLSDIITPNTTEHKAIYNTYNNEQETFLKNFREKA